MDAPEEQDLQTIHRAVLKRARWIKRHVDESRRQRAQALPRNYRSGKSLFYLRRRYQLKVKRQNGRDSSVKVTRGQICVEAPSVEPHLIKERLTDLPATRNRAMNTYHVNDSFAALGS